MTGLNQQQEGAVDPAEPLPFHTRRLTLPDGKGWIEIRGEFNPFDLSKGQRRMLSMMADWFRECEREFAAQSSPETFDESTAPSDPGTPEL